MLTSYQTPDPLPPFTAHQRLAVFSVESREALGAHLADEERRAHQAARLRVRRYRPRRQGRRRRRRRRRTCAPTSRRPRYFEAGRVTSNEGSAHYPLQAPRQPDHVPAHGRRRPPTIASAPGESAITTESPAHGAPGAASRSCASATPSRPASSCRRGILGATAVGRDASKREASRLAGPGRRRVQVPRGGSVEVRFPVKATGRGQRELRVRRGRRAARGTACGSSGASSSRSMLETASIYGEHDERRGRRAWATRRARARTAGGLEVHVAVHGAGRAQDQLRPRDRLPLRLHRAAHEPHPAPARAARDGAPLRRAHARQDRGRRRRGRRRALRAPARLGRLRILGGRRRSGAVALGVRDARHRDGGQEGVLRARGARATAGSTTCARLLDQTRTRRGQRERRARRPGRAAGGRRRGGSRERGAETGPRLRHARLRRRRARVARTSRPGDAQPPLRRARAPSALHAGAAPSRDGRSPVCPAPSSTCWPREIEPRVRADAGVGVRRRGRQRCTRTFSTRRRARRPSCSAPSSRRGPPIRSRRSSRAGSSSIAWTGRGGSTQENVWALLALDDYRTRRGGARARLRRAGLPRARPDRRGVVSRLVDARRAVRRRSRRVPSTGGGRSLTFEVSGQGRLFYSAELTYAPAALPDRAADQGFFVQKNAPRRCAPRNSRRRERVLPSRTEAQRAGRGARARRPAPRVGRAARAGGHRRPPAGGRSSRSTSRSTRARRARTSDAATGRGGRKPRTPARRTGRSAKRRGCTASSRRQGAHVPAARRCRGSTTSATWRAPPTPGDFVVPAHPRRVHVLARRLEVGRAPAASRSAAGAEAARPRTKS